MLFTIFIVYNGTFYAFRDGVMTAMYIRGVFWVFLFYDRIDRALSCFVITRKMGGGVLALFGTRVAPRTLAYFIILVARGIDFISTLFASFSSDNLYGDIASFLSSRFKRGDRVISGSPSTIVAYGRNSSGFSIGRNGLARANIILRVALRLVFFVDLERHALYNGLPRLVSLIVIIGYRFSCGRYALRGLVYENTR